MSGSPEQLDVAIVGGGLAGNLLARQLHRTTPELRVGLFERTSQVSYKVGEATVEIAANYLIRKQGLSQYLYENQLPKNGIRYFFDRADRSAPLEELSEIGTRGLPSHPAFQLNRSRLETDLLAMNRADGIHVRTGASVGRIAFGENGAPHRFEVSCDGKTMAYESRWIIDAGGRSGLFARLKGLKVAEESHLLGSVWGRYEGVADIDEQGAEEFRARVRHTSRRLSTLHFWYPGYWIWVIPLRGGSMSIGVTGTQIAQMKELRTPEGFKKFLDEHRALRDLMTDAKNIDIASYTQIAYGTKQFFHSDRWGLVGEAATAADPLYSPGSDFISLENDCLTDLIRRDLVDGDTVEMTERCELYDQYLQFRHEATMLLYRNLYEGPGSYELGRLKWDFDIACYYNLWLSSYLNDQHLDRDFLNSQLKSKPFILQALKNFSKLFQQVDSALRERGDYFRANTGQFYNGLASMDFLESVGTMRSEAEVLQKTEEIFNAVRAQALQLLGKVSSADEVKPLPLVEFLGRRAID